MRLYALNAHEGSKRVYGKWEAKVMGRLAATWVSSVLRSCSTRSRTTVRATLPYLYRTLRGEGWCHSPSLS